MIFALNFSARNVYVPEEQRELAESNDDYNRIEDLFKMLQYEKNHPREFDRLNQKRAKAIVKGDPREFMG